MEGRIEGFRNSGRATFAMLTPSDASNIETANATSAQGDVLRGGVGVVGDGELKLTEDSDLERIVFAIGEI